MVKTNRIRKGFSLVELVVVILIMGVLAAVAAPKMFDKAETAKINGTKQSLAVLRDAIELFKSENGSYPINAAALISTDTSVGVAGLIKGPFPSNQILGGDDAIKVENDTAFSAVKPGFGWLYDGSTGRIAINSDDHLTD